MKCIIHTNTTKNDGGVVVKRKFVPIRITIKQKNQCVNAAAKLPFTTSKVLGVLTIPFVTPCSDDILPPRYYVGTSTNQMLDTRFLADNSGTIYDTTYPPNVTVNTEPDTWWYYAHPVLDKLPTVLENGAFLDLGRPKSISIQQQGQCNADPYYLWSGLLPNQGWVFITFFPPS